MADYDSPWKEALDRYFEALLLFFFPLAPPDDDPSWRPSAYGYGRWGSWTGTKFLPVKLLDYAAQWQALEASPNPFAVVALAHLKALETRKAPAERQVWKLRLVKGLYERGM